MKTVYGSNNWELTIRRDDDGVAILRAVTCDACAALPDTLYGLPVIALGDHALSPGAADVPGERLRIDGAPCGAPWDNRSLRELTLPAQLRSVGGYALMNCRALQTLRLSDRAVAWGVGALMNCRTLDSVFLTHTTGDAGSAVAYFSGELSGELDIELLRDGAPAAHLVFPEYYEDFEENSPAHHFDYKVRGAGQPYHQVFRSRVLNYYDYDALWTRFLSGGHEPETALRLAWWRVCCPEGLRAEAKARYCAYLSAHAPEAFSYVLSLRDAALLRRLLEQIDCDAAEIRGAAELARRSGHTAAVALLLEELRGRGGTEKSFEL